MAGGNTYPEVLEPMSTVASDVLYLPLLEPSLSPTPVLGRLAMVTILQAGAVNDYAAYQAVLAEAETEAQQAWAFPEVAKFGQKVPYLVAKRYFPEIEEHRYRP